MAGNNYWVEAVKLCQSKHLKLIITNNPWSLNFTIVRTTFVSGNFSPGSALEARQLSRACCYIPRELEIKGQKKTKYGVDPDPCLFLPRIHELRHLVSREGLWLGESQNLSQLNPIYFAG